MPSKSITALREEKQALESEQARLIKRGQNGGADFKSLNAQLYDVRQKLDENAAALEEAELDLKPGYKSTERRVPDIVRDGSKGSSERQLKSIGEMFIESAAFTHFDRARKSGPSVEFDVELKALLDSSDWVTDRSYSASSTVLPVETPRNLLSRLPSSPTSDSKVSYMEETTTTSGAATVAEGAEKPESALSFTEREDDVRKIATHIPVTMEQLEDVNGMREYINSRLGDFVMAVAEQQVLNGDGTPPNISGILDRSIQTQAVGSDPVPDAILDAIVKVQVNGGVDPNILIIHPNDYKAIRKLTTTDGVYIFRDGNVWDLPVLTTTRIAENTALVGYTGSTLVRWRKGLTIALGHIDDQFTHNTVTILAECRLALQVFSPAQWCQVTGV
jgi:hypothetical protein